jgi:hypothetical protein
MKKIKLIAFVLLAALVSLSLGSCKKCKGEKPRARIINDGTAKSSVQIKTSGGNTININNVDPGTTSEFAEYDKGNVEFTVTTGKNVTVYSVDMLECFEYNIRIDGNNNVTSEPTDRNK